MPRDDNWQRLNRHLITPPPRPEPPAQRDRVRRSPPITRAQPQVSQPQVSQPRVSQPQVSQPQVTQPRSSRRQDSRRSASGRRPDPDSASGRILLLGLGSVGVILLLIAYPTSRDRIGIVPPLPAGGQVNSSRGRSDARLTITGNPVLTRWGTVQVQIVVQHDRIVKARGVRYPDLNWHGQALNGRAVPELDHEVIARQQANLDAVSGATITSFGYEQSLQSAIDRIHVYEQSAPA